MALVAIAMFVVLPFLTASRSKILSQILGISVAIWTLLLHGNIIFVVAILTVVVFWRSPSYEYFTTKPETFGLVLLLITGVSVVTNQLQLSSPNYIALYLGLELQSISGYIIAMLNVEDCDRKNHISSILRYFILSSFFSGMIVLGISYVYLQDGSMVLNKLSTGHHGLIGNTGLLMIALGLVGKIGIVPLHFWVSDLYKTLHFHTIAIISVVPKISELMWLYHTPIKNIILIVGVLSAIMGSLGMLRQKDLRKFLAYSTISNLGYIVTAHSLLIGGSMFDFTATNKYLLIYFLATIVFLALLGVLRVNKAGLVTANQLEGLFGFNKFIAIGMMVSLMSYSGLPPFMGFFAKLDVMIEATSAAGWNIVVIPMIIATIFPCFAYLNLIKAILTPSSINRFTLASKMGPLLSVYILAICLFLSFGFFIYRYVDKISQLGLY